MIISTAPEEEPTQRPFEHYTKSEFREMYNEEDQDSQVQIYIVAIDATGLVTDEGRIISRKPSQIRVFYSAKYKTGMVAEVGMDPIIIMHVDDIIDYDRVSQLHPMSDAPVYIEVIGGRYEDRDVYFEEGWFRDDYYPIDVTPEEGVKND